MVNIKNSKEYRIYKNLEHWKPNNEILFVEQLTDSKKKLSSLFTYLYHKTKEEYNSFPRRKNGYDSFIHPLNIVWDLKKAKINDSVTLCAGLTHDLVEEKVDIYKVEKNLSEKNKEDIQTLDNYELTVLKEIENDLYKFSKKNKISVKVINELIAIVKLLTRHKRDMYYRSISGIFCHKNEKIKEKAIQVKLADRIHNIQSLESFDAQDKIYQCFKNMFILNNTKNYLLKKNNLSEFYSTEKLFKKCCKATYDAFMTICNDSLAQGINKTESMLQLAFKKFAYEKEGLGKVTDVDKKEFHPIKIYQGIIRKYDYRLHQEWKKFSMIKNDEQEYFIQFFSDYNFSIVQIKNIINYKDAYALKESLAKLLYGKNHLISNFGCNELCRRGKKCILND